MPKPEQGDWWDRSYSVVSGCNWYAEGTMPRECENCFMRDYLTFRPHIRGQSGKQRPADVVTCHPERLEWIKNTGQALTWLCSIQGDLFHPEVPDLFILQVLQHIELVNFERERRGRRVHQVWILTKRYERAREIMADGIPLAPGLYIMGSAGTQERADEAVGALRRQPWPWGLHIVLPAGINPSWVVIGGESGRHARITEPEWISSLVAQASGLGAAVWVKAIGAAWARREGLPGKGGTREQWPERWPRWRA